MGHSKRIEKETCSNDKEIKEEFLREDIQYNIFREIHLVKCQTQYKNAILRIHNVTFYIPILYMCVWFVSIR